jgi:hypothetical protein
MTAVTALERLRRGVLERRAAIGAAFFAAFALGALPLAWRHGGGIGITVAALAVAAAAIALYRHDRRRVDARWIARGLDAADRRFDDSAELLYRDDAELGLLAGLQKQRLVQRLADGAPDLRPAVPTRALGVAFAIALAVAALAIWLPAGSLLPHGATNDVATTNVAGATTAITAARLAIVPPAYTGLPERTESSLDGRVPEGAQLTWQLTLSTEPAAVALEFHDGTRTALARDGTRWTGTRTLAQSALYRVVVDGAPPVAPDTLHRLDATPDQPPEVRVTAPDKTLTLLEADQKTWELAFEGSDDYGLGDATLAITLAQGTGENLTFKEQSIVLTGDGDARQRRYRHTLDLGSLGIHAGDDVIVKLALADNRAPTPNVTRSASFILRWPPEASAESAGMDGLVRKTLPAYFRSQRQIIIDTEALVADKANLSEDELVEKSDKIGVDQKILRLRYGQFLGEEFETQAAEKPAEAGHDEHDHDEHGDDEHGSNEKKAPTQSDALTQHDHGAPAGGKFGDAGNVLAQFGHTHDHAEAATLLDPQTRAILKAALDEMWQAERELRTGKPDAALPYEYKALDYIKQVQQATRIYLARVGLELPALDETRRLTGDRKGVTDPADALAAALADPAATNLSRALADGTTPDYAAFDAWLAQHGKKLPDELGLRAALDAARRDPACAECRERARGLLWPALPTPAAAPSLRPAPDASGDAYLDALRRGAAQ